MKFSRPSICDATKEQLQVFMELDINLLPLNTIFVLLLNEADSLEDVGDVVDPPLLLHVQRVRGLKAEKRLVDFEIKNGWQLPKLNLLKI